MVAGFVDRAATLPAKLNVLQVRVAAKSFGYAGRHCARAPPHLRGQAEVLSLGETCRQPVDQASQLPRQPPSLQVGEVRHFLNRFAHCARLSNLHFYSSISSYAFNSAMVMAV